MDNSTHEGHRQRLRAKFIADPSSLTQTQILELLLTFAIPRRDVAELAQDLIIRFETIDNLFTASIESLREIEGIGDNAATLLSLVGYLLATYNGSTEMMKEPMPMVRNTANMENQQIFAGFDNESELYSNSADFYTYANDEVANALSFIPKAVQFDSLEAFRAFLADKLPYNSVSTRQRRASYILKRFYPNDQINTPLTYFAARCSVDDLKPVLFYHILKAEPMMAKVADEFVWSALPIGYIERENLRRFILGLQPDLSASSQKNILRSILQTYELLSLGQRAKDKLNLKTQIGTAGSFLYVLTSEFPHPGMYTFDDLETGIMRRWLLWDREWIRQQLYEFRDAGLISKVSEIDNIRQFTLAEDQMTLLDQFFRTI